MKLKMNIIFFIIILIIMFPAWCDESIESHDCNCDTDVTLPSIEFDSGLNAEESPVIFKPVMYDSGDLSWFKTANNMKSSDSNSNTNMHS